jgi:hypothetical protein
VVQVTLAVVAKLAAAMVVVEVRAVKAMVVMAGVATVTAADSIKLESREPQTDSHRRGTTATTQTLRCVYVCACV